MMVYRSLVLGMLGAIALLVAGIPQPTPAGVEAAAPVAVMAPDLEAPPVALVDVSRERMRDQELLPLLGLAPGERIIGIGGIAATSTDLATRWRYTLAGNYLDVFVRGPGGDRRILVLAHL